MESKHQLLEYEKLSMEQMIEEGDYVTSREDLQVTEKPKIAKGCPIRIKLEKGKSYLYCTCGYSQNQPFCDGAHRKLNNGYKPLKVDVKYTYSNMSWCGCKQNDLRAGPKCDGNHINIEW